jgi:FtsP/CotA-like multicopper oxidase with cupredoxin domain
LRYTRPGTSRPQISQVTRRRFLVAGVSAAISGIALAKGSAVVRAGSGRPGTDLAGEPLMEPPIRSSSGGLLQTSLEARTVSHQVGGRNVLSNVYERMFPAPTLHVRPGDTVKLHLSNQLEDITNLHLHGFHVSPSGNSDNVLLHIHPGESFDYEYHIPADHPAGLYWYHPHFHGLTTPQVFGGMAGAIIVEGDIDQIPGIEGARERLLLLHAIQLKGDSPIAFFDRNQVNFLRTVNGQLNPTFTIQPGETQRLRIANVSDSTWFWLKLDGHRMHQIAKDGNTYKRLVPRDDILIAPAERVEVLIQGGAPGSYSLRSLPFDQGFAVLPETVLATMVSQGSPVASAPLPSSLIPFNDLSKATVDRRRVITWQVLPRDDPQRANFLINNKLFDEDRVDIIPLLNSTEEWVLQNPSNVFHPFHIHINPFQTISVNGKPVDANSYEDTVSIPPRGEVVIRTRFLDFTGKFVFHCHILPHEDGGMMSVVDVVAPNDPLASTAVNAEGTNAQLLNSLRGNLFTCPVASSS